MIEVNRLCTPRRISPTPWECQSCRKPCPSAPSLTTGNCFYWQPSWALMDPLETPTRAWTPSRIYCSNSSDPTAVGGAQRKSSSIGSSLFQKTISFRAEVEEMKRCRNECRGRDRILSQEGLTASSFCSTVSLSDVTLARFRKGSFSCFGSSYVTRVFSSRSMWMRRRTEQCMKLIRGL